MRCDLDLITLQISVFAYNLMTQVTLLVVQVEYMSPVVAFLTKCFITKFASNLACCVRCV